MQLRYYFDYVSPYAYLGWTQVHAVADRHRVRVEPCPILFAALLNEHGQKGPVEIPAKRAYTYRHVVRLANDYGVPLAPPPTHPFNPLLALRVTSLPMNRDIQRRVVDALFAATWAGGPGVTEPTKVAALLDRLDLPGEQWVAEANTPQSKTRLRDQTQAALERGVFGVPTIEVGGGSEPGELFWGQDALPHVDQYLAGRDPVPRDHAERWDEVPVGARRA